MYKSPLFVLILFIAIIIISFIILYLRLFQLTIVKGSYYRTLADENRIKEFIIDPQRGTILDRKGFTIAKNSIAPNDQSDEHAYSKRTYSASESIGHIIGYQQIADRQDLQNDTCANKLKLGDKIGKKGIEKLFECDLRGKHGKRLVETDANGKILKTLTVISPVSGKQIQLSLDLDLQQKTYEMIKNKKAVVVATKPKTGEVILFVSTPSFSPQIFENGDEDKINQYLTDETKPLFNRITDGVYPPGSIFKLPVIVGALEENKITEKTVFEDTGEIQAGPIKFGNWYFLQYGKTEGMVNAKKALQRSNDIFFYKTGELLGPEMIKKWAEIFGYGKKTGIGFEESIGTIPSPFWKEEVLKEKWYLGDTYNFSIGQGYVLATPLQVALVTNIFANNGYLCMPQLLKQNVRNGSDQNVRNGFKPFPTCIKLPISQKTIDLVREGMRQACSPGGTGWPLFKFKIDNKEIIKEQEIQTGCKTGTAESHGATDKPHAWFTVFAPFDNPEISLTILIEEGGQGSDIAGPIAKEILKAYFERKE